METSTILAPIFAFMILSYSAPYIGRGVPENLSPLVLCLSRAPTFLLSATRDRQPGIFRNSTSPRRHLTIFGNYPYATVDSTEVRCTFLRGKVRHREGSGHRWQQPRRDRQSSERHRLTKRASEEQRLCRLVGRFSVTIIRESMWIIRSGQSWTQTTSTFSLRLLVSATASTWDGSPPISDYPLSIPNLFS